MPAIASPRTNLRGAVHRAVEVGLLARLRARRALASSSSIRPAFRSASIAICLPGIASSVKRAPTSAIALGALGDDDEVDDDQDREHDEADGEVAADHEVAERLDHLAGRAGAGVAVEQHHAGRGDVEREAEQRRAAAAPSGRRRSRAA